MVRIITDSAADFEPWEMEKMQITCIPLTVMFGETEYKENIDLSKEMFYELLAGYGDLPKTAQASPQLLMEIFEAAHQGGDEAIYFTLSSGLSGTYQNAVMTRDMLEYDDCFVVDSRNATGGQRIVLEYAVKLRDQGKTASEIVEAVEEMRSRITLYACMFTMENLYKGGRISHTTYKLGTLANIKPIITLDTQGYIQVPAKAMGMRKGVDFMCKRLELKKPDPEFPLYAMYTDDRDAGREMAKKLNAAGWTVDEDHIIQVGAAIGTHIGPGACGLVYVAEK